MAKLKDWANAAEVGTRFPPSRYDCPQCGQPAQDDNWPPNYGHGSYSNGYWSEHSSQKCVCVQCRIAFVVTESKESWYVMRREHVIRHDVKHSPPQPLVEHDGYLLTPHDVWCEEYKAEHGKYPELAYG